MPDRAVKLHQFAGPKATRRVGSSHSLQGTCRAVVCLTMGPLPGVSVREKGGQSQPRPSGGFSFESVGVESNAKVDSSAVAQVKLILQRGSNNENLLTVKKK